MISRTFTVVSVLALAVLASSCTMDVSADPKYQRGWIPGREYELRHPMALIHDTGIGKVYFEPDKEDQSLGTVLGQDSGHDLVLVEHAPAGTRFRVDKLIREVNPMMTITSPEGHIVSGPHRGSVLELSQVSRDEEVKDEIIFRRDDAVVSPARTLTTTGSK